MPMTLWVSKYINGRDQKHINIMTVTTQRETTLIELNNTIIKIEMQTDIVTRE